jgi:hypothetical protein
MVASFSVACILEKAPGRGQVLRPVLRPTRLWICADVRPRRPIRTWVQALAGNSGLGAAGGPAMSMIEVARVPPGEHQKHGHSNDLRIRRTTW